MMHIYTYNEYDVSRAGSNYLLSCPGEIRNCISLPAALGALDRILVSRTEHLAHQAWDMAALECCTEGRDYCRLFL